MSGVTPDELSKMKAKGLSDGHFIKLICLGLSNQEYNLASAAKYIPLSDQGIFSDIIGRAPTETVQSLIKNTYLNGESVNKVGLAIFAKNLADTPDDAIKWMTTLPSGDSNIAAKSIFSTLMEADPRKASSLLGAMSEGPLRDEGTVVLIKNCLKNGSFSDAQAWLSQISDPKLSASTSELIRKASSKADSR